MNMPKPKTNTYRLETEEQNGVTYPTLVAWRRKPSSDDIARFCRENPGVVVRSTPLDKTAHVYQCRKVEKEGPGPAPLAHVAVFALTPDNRAVMFVLENVPEHTALNAATDACMERGLRYRASDRCVGVVHFSIPTGSPKTKGRTT